MQRTIKRETTRARPRISVPLLRQHTDRPNNSRSLFVQLFTPRTGIPSLVHIRTMPLSLVCVRVAVSSHISRSIRARIYAGQARMHSKRMRVQTRGCPCVSFVHTHAHCWYVCATRGGSAKRATSDHNLDGNCSGKVINRVRERERRKGREKKRKTEGKRKVERTSRLLKRFGSHCTDWSSISSNRKTCRSLIRSLLRKSRRCNWKICSFARGIISLTSVAPKIAE